MSCQRGLWNIFIWWKKCTLLYEWEMKKKKQIRRKHKLNTECSSFYKWKKNHVHWTFVSVIRMDEWIFQIMLTYIFPTFIYHFNLIINLCYAFCGIFNSKNLISFFLVRLIIKSNSAYDFFIMYIYDCFDFICSHFNQGILTNISF